ncbi:histidine phosphatase family protein [Paenibacillus psychroresistens]|uniref:Histidine phosphatase family protein n=1 Tax=Paenibacillus psychroresistens TaxID=1778678 RepID=A0A6B8RKZ3_9BACL|nr:histidine phosphatase family protein [Paenibacillus psychroresistens]QGQ96424.1 histidine phosphatase family protein [Paenibacillus psychroresistens]
MNIYIVRHCKAEGQSLDANLTDEGYLQADRLATFLFDKKIEMIICSPFARANQSILPLAEKLMIEVDTEERLSERILCTVDHPNWREMLHNTFIDFELCYEGGESSRSAMNRVVSVINDLKYSQFNNVVITTHGNLMSLLLKYYDNKRFGFKEWEALSNPDVYHLSIDGISSNIRRIWTDNPL